MPESRVTLLGMLSSALKAFVGAVWLLLAVAPGQIRMRGVHSEGPGYVPPPWLRFVLRASMLPVALGLLSDVSSIAAGRGGFLH